jgi:hypothetical protein
MSSSLYPAKNRGDQQDQWNDHAGKKTSEVSRLEVPMGYESQDETRLENEKGNADRESYRHQKQVKNERSGFHSTAVPKRAAD